MTDSDFEHLVRDASRGDCGAIEDLLTRYLPAMRAWIRRRAGDRVLARESADDLVQSVCRDVLRRLGEERLRFQGEEAFRSWLFHAALLKIQDRGRFYGAAQRTAQREVKLPPEELERFFMSVATPSQDAILDEDLARLRTAFDSLGERERAVITLTRIECRPHAEVATELGISEAASRKLLSRALAELVRNSL